MTVLENRPSTRVLSRFDAATLIREARVGAGLTQAELAERTGTKQSVVSRWERGLDEPRLDTLARILQACGFEADVTFRRHDDVDRTQIAEQLARTPAERARYFDSVIDAYEVARHATRVSSRA